MTMNRRSLLGALTALAAAPMALARRCAPRGEPGPCEGLGIIMHQPGLTLEAVLSDNPSLAACDFSFTDEPDQEPSIGARAFEHYYRTVRRDRKAESGPGPIDVFIPHVGSAECVGILAGDLLPEVTYCARRIRFRPMQFSPEDLPAPDPIDCECAYWGGSLYVGSEGLMHNERCEWARPLHGFHQGIELTDISVVPIPPIRNCVFKR